ncbi:MAG: restriction endonuclease [Dehalococcoidia bacterium]|nr:restriction endonuclease [Dehalococcoidia bacterium]
MKEPVWWGIHAGNITQADSLFLKKSVVAIGWHELGDLKKLGADRDAFKAAVAKTYPKMKPAAIPGQAGQLYRFVYEMVPGDYIIYPSQQDHQVHIGSIVGDYCHDPNLNPEYPNQRQVKWLKHLPRTSFKQGPLYEIGSALTLFQVKNYADEFVKALEGKTEPVAGGVDETVHVVAEGIEQSTRDFIIKKLALDLKGHPFADFVAHLLNSMGYRTRVSPEGTDGGVDIVAHRDELGFEPPIIKVQVKSTVGKVGDPEVSALYGKVDAKEHGLLVALGTFTSQARSFAKTKANLRLIDGEELVGLILAHYEQFDSRYKGILPLKKVYIPESVSDEEG